jgi:glycosyltransferase involved in cell wall biosynthesis
LHVLPPAEEIATFRGRVSGEQPFLLHVGSRYLHKNVERLVDAYSRWPGRQGCVLVLAGGGAPEPGEAERFASAEPAGRVVVLPQVSEHELLLAYHAAQGFVFPSLSEGFGFPLLEALACGCPSAAARAASLPEVGGEAPFYFDPQSESEIQAGLDALMATERGDPRWTSASQAAKARTWPQLAGEYARFYQQVADATGTRNR